MSVAVISGPSTAGVVEHRGSDVAAWTLRDGYRVINWRDAGLRENPLIAPWAVRVLADGTLFATLLYSELAALA